MTTNPRELTDRHNRLWTWDPDMGSYRHDDHTGTWWTNLATLQAEEGPLGAPPTSGSVDDPDVLAERYLELKAKATPPKNVFEYCWERGTADDGPRQLLLWLAFHYHEFGDRSPAMPSLAALGSVLDLSRETIALDLGTLVDIGELAIARDDLVDRYDFPAWQEWLDEQVTTDPDLAAAQAALDSWRAT